MRRLASARSAAAAVQAKHGDICSGRRVQAGPTSSTTFGKKAGPPALPCRDDVLVANCAAVPKSCLSPLEMRTPIAAGGLLPAGKAAITTRITYNQPRLRFCPTEETNSKRTSIQYALSYSSFWRNNQLAAPFCRRVIETKLGQTLVFNPGGSTGHLRACPFLGTWRALLCGEVLIWAPDDGDLQRFFGRLLLLLFLTFSALVAKVLYTVANPARGLLDREKKEEEKVWQRPPPPRPPPRALCSFGGEKKNHATHPHV